MAVAIATAILFFIPTGYESQNPALSATATILEVDNEEVLQFNIIKTGSQKVSLRIDNTRYKGSKHTAYNQLIGKLELDKFLQKGDRVFVTLETTDNHIDFVNVIDHYRLDIEWILFAAFIILLIAFAGITGIKALLSFLFTGLAIWKLLLPFFLKGYNPLLTAFGVVALLTFVIIFLVAGLNRKGFSAFLGAMTGVFFTAVLSIFFGQYFHIHGAVKPFSESLLYSGYAHLNLSDIFLSGIFIASSGAVMDIAMDIASAQWEIINHHPDITCKRLIYSGFTIGRAVIGTMTTTLLLAYSGSFSALLMVFLAQRVPATNMFNLSYVSSEILHTMVGSFGLILVAPFTAIISAVIYTRMRKN